jgi:carbon storage regulator
MLVLTRKLQETLKIGHDIEVSILSIEGDQVKLGINAPKHVEIHRKEIYLAIQEENNQASQTSKDALNHIKSIKNIRNTTKD